MTTLQILSIGTFLMAYYYYVLRTYNALGFRMFSLFFFVGFGVCYWWSTTCASLKDVQANGVSAQALVLEKTVNSLVVRFADLSGKSINRTQTGGISVDEFAALTEEQSTPILYNPQSDTVFLASSFRRQLKDT